MLLTACRQPSQPPGRVLYYTVQASVTPVPTPSPTVQPVRHRPPTRRAGVVAEAVSAPVPLTPVTEAIMSKWGPVEGPRAVRVAMCESGLNPKTTGRSGERGVFQIHPVHKGWILASGYTWDQMYEVGPNLDMAYRLWQGRGWRPWTCKGVR